MKLKTLKDLKCILPDMIINNNFVHKEILKSEAIKWVKSRRDHKNTPSHTETWLMMDFFNITEDELK